MYNCIPPPRRVLRDLEIYALIFTTTPLDPEYTAKPQFQSALKRALRPQPETPNKF